jgi:hypothetical protein
MKTIGKEDIKSDSDSKSNSENSQNSDSKDSEEEEEEKSKLPEFDKKNSISCYEFDKKKKVISKKASGNTFINK